MNSNLSLFPDASAGPKSVPLAEKMRPKSWEDFRGVEGIDRELIERLKSGQGRAPSLILWGPPGSGKTTLAKLIGQNYKCNFVELSSVLAGVKEIREVTAQAKLSKLPTVLFVDEIHRFNKGQQDAFLPHVEAGTISLIGATTENPSFYLTQALLSRCKVIVLPSLDKNSLHEILTHAQVQVGVKLEQQAEALLIEYCSGDARRLLNALEEISDKVKGDITPELVKRFLGSKRTQFYDREGEEHYNIVSAFIKSMRGSDPDAALYWGFRMIEGGEDPRFLIRRMIIFASEDIGNADAQALPLAVATLNAFEHIGLPEGKIPIAQCITYLATAKKSNASYAAMKLALEAVEQNPKAAVPIHLRNAPTKLMKELGYAKDYKYSHDFKDEEGAQQYLPDELKERKFY